MDDYLKYNRARWDESVGIHVNSKTGFYGLDRFRAGEDVLGPIESSEVGDVSGKRLLHLQCHFGLDTLCLARRGATVTGLDFSSEAIATARALSEETDVTATFVEGDLYSAPTLVDGEFDIVYVTWGAITWLPDISRWATVVAHFLAPGGSLYLLEGHPVAMALDQSKDGRLVPSYPYFQGPEPMIWNEPETYTGDDVKLTNTRSYEWNHSLSAIINGLVGSGLTLEYLNEHKRLAWPLFPCMAEAGEGMYELPESVPSLPLAFSLKATRRA